MGQAILISLGAFAEDMGEGEPDSEVEATSTEDQPEREAAPVEEDTAPQEEPVTTAPEDTVSPQPEGGSGITRDATRKAAEEAAAVSPQPEGGSGITGDDTNPQDAVEETEEAEEKSVDSVLPDGFIAINREGRTRDGSVPYIILKNQLDRMR